jgi:hypothetical protein
MDYDGNQASALHPFYSGSAQKWRVLGRITKSSCGWPFAVKLELHRDVWGGPIPIFQSKDEMFGYAPFPTQSSLDAQLDKCQRVNLIPLLLNIGSGAVIVLALTILSESVLRRREARNTYG